jgi:hypothetical protein
MIAAAWSVSACTDSPPVDEHLTFSVRVAPIPDEVTDMRVDGVSMLSDYTEGARALLYETEFLNYEVGVMSPPIRFEFLIGDTIRNTGYAVPGACAMVCVYAGCPLPEEITEEAIQIDPLMDFFEFGFITLRCVGGARSATITA